MILIPFGKIKIAVYFGFFAVISLIILLDGNGCASYAMAACILHEAGHLAVMSAVGLPVKRICLYGAGIKIVPEKKFIGYAKELVVLLGGVMMNFVLFALFCFLSENEDAKLFAAVNLVTGGFNLLPLKGFDGGRIVSLAAEKYMSADRTAYAENIVKFMNIAAFAAAFCGAFIVGFGNLTFYVTLIYFMISELLL